MEITKKIKTQDAGLKYSSAKSGETSINLSQEIVEMLCGKAVHRPAEFKMSFIVTKSDFVNAMCFILSHLPLYKTSSKEGVLVERNLDLVKSYTEKIESFFGEEEQKVYVCNLKLREDGRNYLNNLKNEDFSLRDFLVEDCSVLTFGRSDVSNYIRLGNEERNQSEPILRVSDPNHCKFAFKCVTYFKEQPFWSNIDDYVEDFELDQSIKVGYNTSYGLTGMFKYTPSDNIPVLNSPRRRWYTEPFIIKEKEVYLSTEWYPGNDGANRPLEIPKLGEFIKVCFGSNYEVKRNEEEGKWELWEYPLNEQTSIKEKKKHPVTLDLFSSKFSISRMISLIEGTGLLYDPVLVKRFAFSLMSKPFVILSGLAGSGKTQLALAFASALIQDDSQMCVVPVGADWTNREPLLGFPNALQADTYVRPESGVLDLLIEANKPENANKPYFLILDEMNMSYVERYFADFLSAMESHKAIPLWKGNGDTPQSICLPKNLLIIGTINVDETTYMFSPKVLDRANVIEFKIAGEEMVKFLQEMKPIDRDSINYQGADMGADFVRCITDKELAQDASIKDTLTSFFNDLKAVNAEFGYRSATEIYRFISQAKKNDDTEEKMELDDIIDCAIVQKLLPKLHGSRKKLDGTLNALWKECFKDESMKELQLIDKDSVEKATLKLTADKILRMYEAAMANGFTSFSEA